MKALIRNKYETITEEMDLPYIDWSSGYPLTDPKWCGGPYTLVQNYVPPANDEVIVEDPEPIEETPSVQEEDDDYVVIGGVRYSKAELRSLIE